MKDVAARAGVSWKTVSNVINGRRNVGPAARARVEEAIVELGYRTSVAGRQLRSGRTRILALAVPQLTIPYFAELAHEIIRCAEPRGYTVLISETDSRADVERAVARGYDTQFADGIIFTPVALASDRVLEHLGTTPLVLLGERGGGSGLDHVAIDNVASGRQATEHVLDGGRRRVVFIGASSSRPFGTGWLRMTGCRQALQAAGLPVREHDVLDAQTFDREEGARAVHRLVVAGRPFDALVAANDLLALGAVHALRRHGVRVPDDVAVSGWDNSPEGAYSAPTLTSVAADIGALAEHAVDRVVRRIEGETPSPEEILVGHRLIVRESTTRLSAPDPSGLALPRRADGET